MPIPATLDRDRRAVRAEGYIGISVGRAELVFAPPLASFGPLGQTLLMAARRRTARRPDRGGEPS